MDFIDPSKASRKPTNHRLLGILAFTQVFSWGSLYYAFSILAPAAQRELGVSGDILYGGFMGSILLSGLVAPAVGRALDRWGGRTIMALGSFVSGLGCLTLGWTTNPAGLVLGLTLVGLGMATTLYDAAFATIVQDSEAKARLTISVLTLFGGLASTAFWPLSAFLLPSFGWHGVYNLYGWGHLLICLPLHLLLPRRVSRQHLPFQAPSAPSALGVKETARSPVFWFLAIAFSTNSFVFSALAIQLIPLLLKWGHPTQGILWITALIGPMQVLGRLAEMSFGRRWHIQKVGLIPFLLLPVAFLDLFFFGTHFLLVLIFCCLYGISNGLMTIVRGVIPKELFGPHHYGAVSGLLSGLAVIFRAIGPLVLGLLFQQDSGPQPATALLLSVSTLSLLFFLLSSFSKRTKLP